MAASDRIVSLSSSSISLMRSSGSLVRFTCEKIAKIALEKLEIDELGLDNIDRLMLEAIIKKFAGGPVGVETLAATIGEDTSAIEDMYEPYLLQLGFIARTPRGRCATRLAYEHYGVAMPTNTQMSFE